MRLKPVRPVTLVPAPPVPSAEQLSLYDRRARAAARAWSLMGTSIPTRDILSSYLDEVLA